MSFDPAAEQAIEDKLAELRAAFQTACEGASKQQIQLLQAQMQLDQAAALSGDYDTAVIAQADARSALAAQMDAIS